MFSRLILDRPSEPWQQVLTPHPRIPMTQGNKSKRQYCDPPTLPHPPVPQRKGTAWLQPIERRWRSRKPPNFLHWLAVATDTTLRTLRDLRGHHVPMLISLYTQTCQKIHEETGISHDQIMAYVHYPPSVYQLHIHFKHPIGPHISHDSFRIHPLTTVINNLKIDSDYYAKSILQLPVYSHTDLYAALGLTCKREQIQILDTGNEADPDFGPAPANQFQTQALPLCVPQASSGESVEKDTEELIEWHKVLEIAAWQA
jgi:hypothetical protein